MRKSRSASDARNDYGCARRASDNAFAQFPALRERNDESAHEPVSGPHWLQRLGFIDSGPEFRAFSNGDGPSLAHFVNDGLRSASGQLAGLAEALAGFAREYVELRIVSDDNVAKIADLRIGLRSGVRRGPGIAAIVQIENDRQPGRSCEFERSKGCASGGFSCEHCAGRDQGAV